MGHTSRRLSREAGRGVVDRSATVTTGEGETVRSPPHERTRHQRSDETGQPITAPGDRDDLARTSITQRLPHDLVDAQPEQTGTGTGDTEAFVEFRPDEPGQNGGDRHRTVPQLPGERLGEHER